MGASPYLLLQYPHLFCRLLKCLLIDLYDQNVTGSVCPVTFCLFSFTIVPNSSDFSNHVFWDALRDECETLDEYTRAIFKRIEMNFVSKWSLRMNTLIKNKQLMYLCLCNFAILFTGFGLFPLLPLYAGEFNASSSVIGILMATTYIASSSGSILGAQLSDRFSHRTLYIAGGWIGTPALLLLGQARAFWQVVALTALIWFVGGMGVSISGVLASLHTTSATRAKAFGMLAFASSLSALISGLILGRLVDRGGYSWMFATLAIVWTIWPVLASTRVQEPPTCNSPVDISNKTAPSPGSVQHFGTLFLALLATVLLASMTVNIGRMGLSLAMRGEQFSAGDISTANAIGGLVTIPTTLLIGMFADRFGNKRFLLLSYLIATSGTLLLVGAHKFWQFWMVSSLVMASRSMISSLSPAYATTLLPRRSLGKALPLVTTMGSVSGVAGSVGAGYVLDTFGAASLYGMAALLSFIAVIILMWLPASLKTRSVAPAAQMKPALQCAGD